MFCSFPLANRLSRIILADIVRHPHVRVIEISERNRGDSIVIDDMLSALPNTNG